MSKHSEVNNWFFSLIFFLVVFGGVALFLSYKISQSLSIDFSMVGTAVGLSFLLLIAVGLLNEYNPGSLSYFWPVLMMALFYFWCPVLTEIAKVPASFDDIFLNRNIEPTIRWFGDSFIQKIIGLSIGILGCFIELNRNKI